MALTCYRHQTYVRRELIIVDDGDRFPVDPRDVAAEGGRLIRTRPGTPLGAKLNVGITATHGYLCLKMDDDDWYGPQFVETMVTRLLAEWRDASQATMVGAAPFLIFDLARWAILQTVSSHTGGGSFVFRREDWKRARSGPSPSRRTLPISQGPGRGGNAFVDGRDSREYVAIRHGGRV